MFLSFVRDRVAAPRLWAAAGLAIAAALFVSPAAASAHDRSLTFVCAGGTSFIVTADDSRVRVTTSVASYQLPRLRSSIGRLYASPTTAFMQDEERAVLIGAEGGPFRNCRQR